MLRSLASLGRTSYTCLCLQQSARALDAVHGNCIRYGLQAIHTTSNFEALPKDLKGKKAHIARSQEEKFEQTEESTDIDIEGLYQAGFMTPTWETLNMVVDGVKYSELPIVHIKSSLNNTIVSLTDHNGAPIMPTLSCGTEGFRNAKKSTSVAAQATGLSLGSKAFKKGIRSVRVTVKGLGVGREASLTGLKMGGLNIISITDRTPIKVGGPKPRKQRRL